MKVKKKKKVPGRVNLRRQVNPGDQDEGHGHKRGVLQVMGQEGGGENLSMPQGRKVPEEALPLY